MEREKERMSRKTGSQDHTAILCSANVKDYSVIVVIKSLIERCIHFTSKHVVNV